VFKPKPEPRKAGLAYYLVRFAAVGLPALLVANFLFSAAALVLVVQSSADRPWQGTLRQAEEGRAKGGPLVITELAAPTADPTRPGGRKLEPTNAATPVRAPTLSPSPAPSGEQPTPPGDHALSPPHPTRPSHPTHPAHPAHPTHPTHPPHPSHPSHPTQPTPPTQPIHPTHPPHPPHPPHPSATDTPHSTQPHA
jgi:hypothetical protein